MNGTFFNQVKVSFNHYTSQVPLHLLPCNIHVSTFLARDLTMAILLPGQCCLACAALGGQEIGIGSQVIISIITFALTPHNGDFTTGSVLPSMSALGCQGISIVVHSFSNFLSKVKFCLASHHGDFTTGSVLPSMCSPRGSGNQHWDACTA